MRPALSVLLLTTLIGAGQGLLLVVWAADLAASLADRAPPPDALRVAAGLAAFVLAAAGLAASFFHLGRPARAWRSAAQWRTSWLSREVIVLPAFMALALADAFAHHPAGAALRPWQEAIGFAAAAAAIALFVCTGMIYACLKFLQEWATPLTVVNFALLGLSSGATLAAALAALHDAPAAPAYARAAIALTALALLGRGLALARNASLRPKSTLATAIGVRHPRIRQIATGFLGGSFNTREFFHDRTRLFVRGMRAWALVGGFGLPVLLLAAGIAAGGVLWPALAALVQWSGLLAERWYFFAEARHPQNLYYSALA